MAGIFFLAVFFLALVGIVKLLAAALSSAADFVGDQLQYKREAQNQEIRDQAARVVLQDFNAEYEKKTIEAIIKGKS